MDRSAWFAFLLLTSAGSVAASEPTRDELIGLWYGYIDGSQPPGWLMDLRADGNVTFFSRQIVPEFKLRSGQTAEVPVYRLMQTVPLVTVKGGIDNHLTGLFHVRKIPERLVPEFDYSIKSQVEVVLEAHGGAFTLGIEPNAHWYFPDYWTYENGDIAIKGHVFDVDVDADGILGFFPYRACPYDDQNAGPKPHPDCGDEGLSWQKNVKPTFTWKKATDEALIAESALFGTLEIMRWAWGNTPAREAESHVYQVGSRRWLFGDLLASIRQHVDDPVVGQIVLDYAVPCCAGRPKTKRGGHGERLQSALDSGFGRWLTTPMIERDGTLCDYYLTYTLVEPARSLLARQCSGDSPASPNTTETPVADSSEQAPIADETSAQTATAATVPGTRSVPTSAQTTTAATAPATSRVPRKEQDTKTDPPLWETIGFWDYDGVDGQLIPQGLVLIDAAGASHGEDWRLELRLVEHDELRPRERALWPVHINRRDRRICVPYPYPTYRATIIDSGDATNGVYEFASCEPGL